ncbi:MAG: hypothetical protein KDB61_14130, partial [Planctomycetes bacterium]|nr:hypothetical protein [Planctomycetota bacterium]
MSGCNALPQLGTNKQNPDRIQVVNQSAHVEITDHGDSKFTIELKRAKHVFTQQKTDVTCWAACASMIHAINGETISQTDIIKRVQGEGPEEGNEEWLESDGARPATFFEVVRALTPDMGDLTFAQTVGNTLDGALSELDQGRLATDVDFKSGVAIRGFLKENILSNRNPAIDDLKDGHGAFVALKGPESAEDEGHAYVLVGATFK